MADAVVSAASLGFSIAGSLSGDDVDDADVGDVPERSMIGIADHVVAVATVLP